MASINDYMNNRAANDSTIYSLFDQWSGDGVDYIIGKTVMYGGVIYKCLQAHTSQSDWNPEDAASLWAEVLTATDDSGDIPEWVQPDSTNPYMMGDKVIFEGKVYESLIDNNVWSPAAYPAGWREVTS